MKNLPFFLLLALGFPLKSIAQDYSPLVVENNFWYFTNTINNMTDPIWSFEFRMYLNGDTLVDGKTYKKIYQSSWPEDFLFGMIREDSTRKVFVRGSSITVIGDCNDSLANGAEALLYDFGLSIGDTVASCIISGKILDIDTIDIDGNLRKRFRIENTNVINEDFWIEGIGSTLGLFGPFVEEFENFWKLRCFKNMDLLFTNGDTNFDDDCNTIVKALELKKRQINIFPNPTNSSLHIADMELDEEVIIYSAMGQTLIKEQTTSSKLELDISNLPSGLYLVVIKRADRISVTGNFIKT